MEGDLPASRTGVETSVQSSIVHDRWFSRSSSVAARALQPEGYTYGPDFLSPEWGTGSAWWVQQADLTGDGYEERIVLAVKEADPEQRAALAIHADGTMRMAFDLRRSGAVTFRVHPANEPIRMCEMRNGFAHSKQWSAPVPMLEFPDWYGYVAVLWHDGEYTTANEVSGYESYWG
jgi:hypothetical protein